MNICVVTGSRAEYGLLKPLLEKIQQENNWRLQLVVTGMHLSADFGLTYKEIENDGFTIEDRVRMLSKTNTAAGIARSIGNGVIGFSACLPKLQPDLIVVLGDRFEIFAAVSAAYILNIPVVHLHGGEVTEGAFDDALRHSITKMSFLHFTSTEEYRKRVIQLGEEPNRVFNVGATALDNIKNLKQLNKAEIERQLKIRFNKRNLLITFHPVTLEKDTVTDQFTVLLKVLDEHKDTTLIFTKANADTGGCKVNKMIDEYCSLRPERAFAFTSLGQLRHLSVMQHVDAVVGNSSSGLVEAPALHIGTINIGDRQKGRIKALSIIDCNPDATSLKEAFRTLYSDNFNSILKRVKNPYGDGYTAGKIVKIIKHFDFKAGLKKRFFDLKFKIADK